MIAAEHIKRPYCKQVHLVPRCIAGLLFKSSANSKSCFLLVLGLLVLTLTHAQDSRVDRAVQPLPFSYTVVEDWNTPFTEIIENQKFTSGNHLKMDVGKTYWFKIDLSNELNMLESKKLWRLRTSHFSEAELYYKSSDTIDNFSFGRFEEDEKKKSFLYENGAPFKKQNLISGTDLFVKAKNYFNYPQMVSFSYLSHSKNRFYTDYFDQRDIRRLTPSLLFLGACSILFLTFIVIFFNTRKVEFLFYSLYVLFSCTYLISLDVPLLHTFFENRVGFWGVTISQVLINLCYVLFAKYYLNTQKQYALLDIIIKVVILILILIVLTHGFTYFTGYYHTQSNILNIQRVIMTTFGLFSMVYLLLNCKDKLALFIVAGSFCYMLGALGFWFTFSKYYMLGGSLLEIMIFSLGLAYKIKLEYEGKVVLQREVSLKDISVKRAQINPHFFFNSLGSIQHLILHNKKNAALNYLNKFSKLARNVLESSYETTVTLAEEIELLRSYLELESLRFDKAFSYTITVADSVNANAVEIPLMLIQPFAENAIIHGLMGKKKGEKKLEFRFFMEREYLVIEIEDNGVGRFYEKPRNSNKKSRGIEITKKRLKMRDTAYTNKNSIEIIDKYDTQSQPSGTKVIIRLNNP